MKSQEKIIAITIKNLANQFHRQMGEARSAILKKIQVPGAETITSVQGRIVSYLYTALFENNEEAVFQKDIEKHFNIRRSTATVILKRMEKNNLITRKVSSTDARMKSIQLTDKSRAMYPIAYAEILKVEKQARKGVSKEELAVFFKVVEQITSNIS